MSLLLQKRLLQELTALHQLEVQKQAGTLEDESEYWAIQRRIIEEAEGKFKGDEIIIDGRGSSFVVTFYEPAQYVRKTARITDPFTPDVLVDWKGLERSFKVVEGKLGGLAARAMQFDKRTYYQIKRTPNREFFRDLLDSLRLESRSRFKRELEALSDEQISSCSTFALLINLIDLFCTTQTTMWSRGVIDLDPKLLDNYGVFFDSKGELQMRMIDFSHCSDRREDYYGVIGDYKGIMKVYNPLNRKGLNQLATEFGLGSLLGEHYITHAPEEADLDRVWPVNGEPCTLTEARITGPVLDTRIYALYKEISDTTVLVDARTPP